MRRLLKRPADQGLEHYAFCVVHQSPPWMAKEDKIKTKVLIRAQTNGIQVDILKYPAL